MNTDTHAAHAGDHHHGDGHAHGTFSTYLLGFVLSVVLTAIPFWLVMSGALPSKQITALVIMPRWNGNAAILRATFHPTS